MPPDLARLAKGAGRLDLVGAPEGFDALVVADLAKAHKGLTVFVARDGPRARDFAAALSFFDPKLEPLHIPSWDCLPYDRTGPSPGVAAERMSALSLLARRPASDTDPLVVIITVPALLQRVPPKAAIAKASYLAKAGQDVAVADLERYFAVNGYVRASTVSERGEFAIRGGVIDVYPPTAAEPVRLDLFGDTLESIRAFDPETQRSTRQLKSVDLLPVSEVLIDKESIARFRSGYVAAFGAVSDDPLYDVVSEGGRRAGMEHFLPLFYDRLDTLFDYVGEGALICLDHLAAEARDERAAMIDDAFDARAEAAKVRGGAVYRPLPVEDLYLSKAEWDERMGDHAERRFSPFVREDGEGVIDLGARIGRSFTPERAQDSVNLFESVADHAKVAGQGRQAGAVRLLVGRLLRTPRDHAGRPRPRQGAPGRRLGRRAGVRRPLEPRPSRPNGRCCRWSMALRPTIWRSSPKPTSSATGFRGRGAGGGRRISWPRPPR